MNAAILSILCVGLFVLTIETGSASAGIMFQSQPDVPSKGFLGTENQGVDGSQGGKEGSQPVVIRAKRDAETRHNAEQIIEVLLCIFLPPGAILVHGGPEVIVHFIINLILWVLGWLPGTIHAFWYCFFRA